MIAEPQYAPDRFERSIKAINTLIDELGIDRHALFHEVGEGEIFPDGTESMSGGVVDEQGRVYTFWTDWDAARGRPVFTTWKQIEPEPRLNADAEYREARASLGLSNVPRGLLRPPGQRYFTWKDSDGIDRVIPEHLVLQAVQSLSLLLGAVVRGVGHLADKIRELGERNRP